jgi:hypothetical protein
LWKKCKWKKMGEKVPFIKKLGVFGSLCWHAMPLPSPIFFT